MTVARSTRSEAGWLFKTDPDTYTFANLEEKRNGDVWDGVANALALKHLREVRAGDSVLVYHTGAERAIVGIAKVTKAPYADPKQDDPKLVVVDLKAVRRLPRPVALAEIKKDPRYREFDLVRMSRLSVMPVPPDLWTDLLTKAGL